jgi:class I fructose-bisphosphate aldolase/fructose-bisphosphate aldolase/2-amino-3,7-dideoxy-D-threo-hept-6-ulosonate synthase
MTGLEKNVEKLFENKGKLLLAAMDHPQFSGAMKGLEKPLEKLSKLSLSEVDGFILNPGIIRHIDDKKVFLKKHIMRITLGGSAFSDFSSCHYSVVTPQTIINSGADAAIMMFILGGHDVDSMKEVSRTIDQLHQFSIPVIVEVLASDFTKTNDYEYVKNGARIAAEMGADVLKVFYCDHFEDVVYSCPVPVMLAGGPKDAGSLHWAKKAIEAGAKGFAFGRNIIQNEEPLKFISELNKLLGRD